MCCPRDSTAGLGNLAKNASHQAATIEEQTKGQHTCGKHIGCYVLHSNYQGGGFRLINSSRHRHPLVFARIQEIDILGTRDQSPNSPPDDDEDIGRLVLPACGRMVNSAQPSDKPVATGRCEAVDTPTTPKDERWLCNAH